MKSYSSVKEMMLEVGLGETDNVFLNLLVYRIVDKTKRGPSLFMKDGFPIRIDEIGNEHATATVECLKPIKEERRLQSSQETVVIPYALIREILRAAERDNFLTVPDDYLHEKNENDSLGVLEFLGLGSTHHSSGRVGSGYDLSYAEEAVDETKNKLVFEYGPKPKKIFNHMTKEAWKNWDDIPYNIVHYYYEEASK